MKILIFTFLFLCTFQLYSDVIEYAWDSQLITTNKEVSGATGYDLWTSPEAIDDTGSEYCFTSRAHIVAYALSLSSVFDGGVSETATNILYPDHLPFEFANELISGTITDSVIVNYSYRLRSYIDTNWKVNIELSDFSSDIPGGTRLEMLGYLSETNGTWAVVTVPEPIFLSWFVILLALYKKLMI